MTTRRATLPVLKSVPGAPATCGAIVLAWFVLAAAVMLVAEPLDGSLVVLGRGMQPADLPGETAILWWDGRLAGLTGSEKGWVADLYRSGALLVLPRRRRSCLSLR